jgi:hypothetical protein
MLTYAQSAAMAPLLTPRSLSDCVPDISTLTVRQVSGGRKYHTCASHSGQTPAGTTL